MLFENHFLLADMRSETRYEMSKILVVFGVLCPRSSAHETLKLCRLQYRLHLENLAHHIFPPAPRTLFPGFCGLLFVQLSS